MSLKSRQKCFGNLIISVLFVLLGGVFSPVWAAPKLELISQVSSANNQAVAVQGNYAYTGDGATLKILDVSNPAKPTVVGTSAQINSDGLFEIVVKGNYAYVANNRGGLRIMDVSNPQNPFQVGVYNTNNPDPNDDWAIWGVDVRDNYAYVADMGSGLRIVDVSNPAKPAEVSFIGTHGLTHAVKLNGNFAYMVDWNGGLVIVDITDPKAPKEVGFYDTKGLTYGVALSDNGNLAYIADYYGGLRIVDISNPKNPQEVGFYSTPGISAVVVVASGNYVYVNSGNELKVLDVSNPQSPQQVDSYNTANGLGRLKLNNGLLYVPNRDGGLLILSTGALTPTITGINPSSGTTAGGTTVTITGTNFVAGSATVTIGGTAATVSSFTATQITCTTPAHAAGAVDVVVTVAGLSATKTGGFTYTTTTSAILTIGDVAAIQGTTNAAVRVSMNNSGTSAVSSMQFDILYNAAAGIHANGSYVLSPRTTGFTISVTPYENGANSKVRVILYNNSGSIAPGTGTIADILFNTDSGAAPGVSTMSLGNCVLSDSSAHQVTSDCTDTAIFKIEPACGSPGDISKDGAINILDLQMLINCIMGRGSCNCCDLNGDSKNNILDIQTLINKINSSVRTHSERDNGQNTLTLPVIKAYKNGTGSFGLNLTNESVVSSGQFVFVYDSSVGLSISKTDIRLTSRTTGFSKDIETDAADPKNVKVTVLLYSMDKTKTITPGSGDILEFIYTTSANAAGNTSLTFAENILGDSGAQPLSVNPQNGSVTISDAVAGDVNGIGGVDLADAILALKVVAGLNPQNVFSSADVNSDNRIGLEEVIYILQKVAGLRP